MNKTKKIYIKKSMEKLEKVISKVGKDWINVDVDKFLKRIRGN